MKLSKLERLLLSNQYRILEALYPDDAEYYENNRKAVEEGFELHYSDLLEGLSENELSTAECREVIDILSMYRALTFSYQKIEDKSGINSYYIKFDGFDLNDEYEGKRVIYARYFINDLDRFEELKYGNSYADCNSHGIRMDRYREMLSRWNGLGRKNILTKEEIKKILG